MIGQSIGHYQIIEELGGGGMGMVYRAHDGRLDRDVAIKFLRSGVIADAHARRKFRDEALALSRLNHPNIATIYDFHTEENNLDFIVMEYIPGSNLSEMLSIGPMAEERIVHLGKQLVAGLIAAHNAHIVHCDLKPGNIRVTPDDRLKILDFGLARFLGLLDNTSDTSSLSGTPQYIAPERLQGRKPDERSDIYCAGVVLYEMATAKPPFSHGSLAPLFRAIESDMPEAPHLLNPNISEGLENIILKALEKKPDNRYQSAESVFEALDNIKTTPLLPQAKALLTAEGPWENRFWHHEVHERLEERLHYYLVRIRPLDHEDIYAKISAFLFQHKLRSVRIFPIFGSYDLLIRAWLRPEFAADFRNELGSLAPQTKLSDFVVRKILQRWYDNTRQLDRSLLGTLDEKAILRVQSGQDAVLLNKMKIGGLVLEPEKGPPRIHFFVAIRSDGTNPDVIKPATRFIKDYLRKSTAFMQVSLYEGIGFCELLFKGQVANFFEIAKFPNEIAREFKEFGLTTETYLVHVAGHSTGDDAIGEATFSAFRGRNLFVLGIVPEVYATENEELREEVERFLINEVRDRDPSGDERSIVRQFVAAYLRSDESDMEHTLLDYFLPVERSLRKHYQKFSGRMKKDLVEAYRAAGVERGKKLLALGDLLKVCAAILKDSPLADENKELLSDWETLANLRNKLAHGEADCMSNWQPYTLIILKYARRIRKLTRFIETDGIDTTAGMPPEVKTSHYRVNRREK